MRGTHRVAAGAAVLFILSASLCLLGCNKEPAQPDQTSPDVAAPSPPQLEPRLHQAFKDATLHEPPDGQFLPPEKTKAGKSVGKLYEQIVGAEGVAGLWDQIVFRTPQAKRVQYTATIKTDLGPIVLELWPEVAPNHVRNFVALAKAGYYDGLEFDRSVFEKLPGNEQGVFECVEAGCPIGDGSANYGSIGYWLKPEISKDLQHDVGTVGASHAEELETAACKFYINLTKAPWMDGNYTIFGKVTNGLDTVRAIRSRPVRDDDPERPVNPVVIRAVIVQSREVD